MKKENSFSIPILIPTFLRVDTLIEVFSVLKQIKPSVLFISSDGPRNSNEERQVLLVRQLIDESICWDCKVYKIYNDVNKGIWENLTDAHELVFSLVDRVIFMEDDVLPSIELFQFFDTMLNLYENNETIKMINGHNLLLGEDITSNEGYFFSKRLSSSCNAFWKRTYLEIKEIQNDLEYYLVNFNLKLIPDQQLRTHINNQIKRQLKTIKSNPTHTSYELILTLLHYEKSSYNIVPQSNLAKIRGNDEYSSNSHKNEFLLPKTIRQMFNKPVNFQFTFTKEVIPIVWETEYDRRIARQLAEGMRFKQFIYKLETTLYYILTGNLSSLMSKTLLRFQRSNKNR